MTTIREIAAACNVSTATVSNILNGKAKASKETIELVRKTAQRLNYTPNYIAKNLKLKTSNTIGVIVEDMTIFNSPDIIDGITEYCEEHKYQILLTNLRLFQKFGDFYYTKNNLGQLIDYELNELRSRQARAVIYVAPHVRDITPISSGLNLPVVMAYCTSPDPRIPSVLADDEDGFYRITKSVLQKGWTRPGLIAAKPGSYHTAERLKGFQRALLEAHLPFSEEFIYYGEWDRRTGCEGAAALTEKSADSILCMSDIIAGGVYDWCHGQNITPGKDIPVTGFDNRELSSYLYPPLTTVNLPLKQIGKKSCEIADRMIAEGQNNCTKTHSLKIQCQVVNRTSLQNKKKPCR